MKEDFNKMSLEQWCVDERSALDSSLTFSNYANCTNDSQSQGNLKEEEQNAYNNLYKILSI
jgi:hypothetical protein